MTRLHARNPSRKAVTLVELLVVIGIATILATLSLTTVKGLLKDQKITQAARLVAQYFDSAQVRALTNGRPVIVYMDRVDLVGGATQPTANNFICTRLSIGEVFPPYTGDFSGVTGRIWDVNFSVGSFPSAYPGPVPSRAADGFADQVRFATADVAAGFGISSADPGFLNEGDTIEFVGYTGRFRIESIEWIGSETVVTFFNPPATYNANRAANAHWEAGYSLSPPIMPAPAKLVSGGPAFLAGPSAATPVASMLSAQPPAVQFRVYRRPSKSLVGAITLPRGTCIDLAVSGMGSGGTGVDTAVLAPSAMIAGGVASGVNPFNLLNSPIGTAAGSPGDFSRVGILFNGQGIASAIVCESSIGGVKVPVGFEVNQPLYLMVGRTEQVLPTEAGDLRSRKLAAMVNTSEDELSNLMDTANRWLVINPYSGQNQTSPVSTVSASTLSVVRASIIADARKPISSVVSEARTLSTAGVTSGDQ